MTTTERHLEPPPDQRPGSLGSRLDPDAGLPIGVTLADDCEVLTQGLARMLGPYSTRVRLTAPGSHRPDRNSREIVLVDCYPTYPLADSLRVEEVQMHAGCLVAWTWAMRGDLVDAALACGFRGYLGKSLPADRLVAALERIARGERVVAPRVTGRATSSRVPLPHREPECDTASVVHPALTPREKDVIALLATGVTNQEIADELFISVNSVKSTIRSAYQKMEVSSRPQAILWAVGHGFSTPAHQ